MSPIEMAQLVEVRIGDQCVRDTFEIARPGRAIGKVILDATQHRRLAQDSTHMLTLKPFNDSD